MSLRVSMLESDSDSQEDDFLSKNYHSPKKRTSPTASSKITNLNTNTSNVLGYDTYSSSKQSLRDLKALEQTYSRMEQTLTQERIELQQRKQKAQAIIRSQIDAISDYDQETIDKILEDTKKAQTFIENNPLNHLEIELKAAKKEVQLLEQQNQEKRARIKLSQSSSASVSADSSPIKSSPSSPVKSNATSMSSIPYGRQANLFLQAERLFSQTLSPPRAGEADEKILALCETIQRKHRELKEEKREIARMEQENKVKREAMEKEYRVQELKLQQLEEMMKTQKQLSAELEQARETVLDKKNELKLLEQEKEQVERQNYTVMRDRIFNKTYKRQIDDLKATIQRKRDEISMNRKVLETQKLNVQKLQEQVEEKERMLEKYEKRVVKLEKDVNDNSISFSDTIEEAKRELDSITDPNGKKSNSSKSIITEEVAELFKDGENPGNNGKPPSYDVYADTLSKLNTILNENLAQNQDDSSDLDPDYFEPQRVSARLSMLSPSPVTTKTEMPNSLISSNYQTEILPNDLSSYTPTKYQQNNKEDSAPNSPYMEELVSLFA